MRIDPRDHDLAEIMIVAGRDISTPLGASPEHALDLKLLLDDAKDEEAPMKKKPAAKKAPVKARRAAAEKATAAGG